MSARYIKTSAPGYVTGGHIYSDGYNPDQIVLESDDTPPVEVGLVPMENISQQQQAMMEPVEEENEVVIEDDNEIEPPVALVEGSGFRMSTPNVPNAVTIIPVGAGLAAEKGLVSEDLPIIHDGTLPEAEIDNALDASVPALLVPVEDVVMSNDGRLALNKRGGMIRAYGYRTGNGDIIYGDGLGNLFKKITSAAKNVGKKIVNVGKNIGKKVVQVGKQAVNKGINLASQGLKKGVQIVKTVVPKVLGDIGQTAVNSTISNVMGAVQGDNGGEEVVYVDEEGNVIGQGFCGGAIYAKGIAYGGAIYARGIYGGGDPGEDDEDVLRFSTSPDDSDSGSRSPVIPSPPGNNSWKMVPKRRQRSASDAARPYRSNPSPIVDIRKERRRWNWPSIPRFSMPTGFHRPDTATIKRLLYIGIMILSFALSVMGASRVYNRIQYNKLIDTSDRDRDIMKERFSYGRRPWDRPDVQRRMMDYLGSEYETRPQWFFPDQDEYVVFPGEYDYPAGSRRLIRRKHLNMLYDILKKKAYENKDVRLFPSYSKMRGTLDIPGLDTYKSMHSLWQPAVDPLQRMKFRSGWYDKKAEPKDFDDID